MYVTGSVVGCISFKGLVVASFASGDKIADSVSFGALVSRDASHE